MSDLLQVLTILAVPASVMLVCRYLNRRDELSDGAGTGSPDRDGIGGNP